MKHCCAVEGREIRYEVAFAEDKVSQPHCKHGLTSRVGSERWKAWQKRLDWLRGRPQLWPISHKEIVRLMKADGLIAPSTYWLDVKLDPMLDILRGEIHRGPARRAKEIAEILTVARGMRVKQ